MKYAHNMQSLQSDCGLAVAKTVLEQFKLIRKEKYFDNIELTYHGLSTFEVSKILIQHGAEASVYEINDVEELFDQKYPFITVVNANGLLHYIVIHKHDKKNNELLVSDPAKPIISKLSKKEFTDSFAGVAIITNSVEKKKIDANKTKSLTKKIYDSVMAKLPVKMKLELSVLVCAKFVMPLLFFELLQSLMQENFANITKTNMIVYGLFYLSFFIGMYLVGIRFAQLKLRIENKLQEKVIFDFYESSMAEAADSENIDNMIGYLSTLIGSSTGISSKFFLKIDALITIGLVLFLFSMHYSFPIIYLAVTIIYIAYVSHSLNDITNFQKNLTLQSNKILSSFEKIISGAFDIRIFQKQMQARNNLEKQTKKFFEAKYLEELLQNKLALLSNLSTFLIIISVLAITFVSYKFYGNVLYPLASGMYVFFIIINSMESMAGDYLTYRLSLTSLDYVQGIKNFSFDTLLEETEKLSVPSVVSGMEIRGINFFYNEGIDVLKDLNYTFCGGRVYVIEGKNGVGKTTFFKLLLGEIAPNKGSIFLNNQEYYGMKNTQVLDVISHYSSEEFIFYGTVQKNISMDVFHDSVDSCEYRSIFSDHLSASKIIFDKGDNISSGQIQKVLLDRCFYKNESSIFLLDEPSSNLDEQARKELNNHLRKLKKQGKIILIISHDSLFHEYADEILIMDGGVIENEEK
ncbi:ATP-binding cassette domain-containing protein [Enterococcus rivorum]|uniref:ABC transporter ATP-binding protein n=1 Tax=Enterococcus rivorum TaxID=762845 RepID=A0A1E5KWY9_9ENTE|nr:ATP-binding cassette domain-containing protein [Enterococcus rivorum]MBP2097282.1 ABC-type bacteriocin/lantibiotic exporter with double-glycine peptidase domain [Enterococcus rivorum]OEH82366.1 hypothetical protein BCR26_02745 [Enterococcus rivorum]